LVGTALAGGVVRQRLSAAGSVVTVSTVPEGPTIAPGYVGLSMEYPTVEDYAGSDPSQLDPVVEQLIRNLSPGQRPVLRIGGNTTDWTWAPVAGMARPPWVRFTMTPSWLNVASTLTRSLNAIVIPTINLEANSPTIASAESRALLSSIGRKAIMAFEIGNEPELYRSFSWYRTAPGVHVTGRPRSYGFSAYLRDYARIARALPGLPLAGPSTGDGRAWTQPLPRFLAREPRLRIVVVHRYGLDHCSRDDPLPTIPRLMAPIAQSGVAATVAIPVREALAHHRRLRIEELNAVACGGEPGVSNTFASALWALDTLLEAARVGVAGVNIHTRSEGVNSLFSTQLVSGRWLAVVEPEYYGILTFAQNIPPGARLLPTAPAVRDTRVHIWAARTPDGHIRVILIDENPRHGTTIRLRIPAARGAAQIERLLAPSLSATSGVTLGGQSLGALTTTGVLGPARLVSIKPTAGQYVVPVRAASATILTATSR
jgi:hypothetical protein